MLYEYKCIQVLGSTRRCFCKCAETIRLHKCRYKYRYGWIYRDIEDTYTDTDTIREQEADTQIISTETKTNREESDND